ncbi:MAG: DUF456 family protein [Flavobacteriaceae bacterium]|nr:DUF456 family protein [Flavobacteriaceae bacterium]
MDALLLVLGFSFVLLGIAGAFLPVLPGPIMAWCGLLFLYLSPSIDMNYWILGFTLLISILIGILDYIIPSMGTKKFGGSKYGAYGTTIGLVIGVFTPVPLGFVIGGFVGAFIGEMIFDSSNIKRAGKAAFGSFIGFLASTTMKFIVSLFIAGIFIQQVIANWEKLAL